MQRGIHDIHHSFAFKSNPGFIFHDSPGFETGDEKQLQDVLSFLEEKAKSPEVDDQLHVIWSVSLSQLIYQPLMVNSAVKVLFCSEQCSAATPTGNEVFWDGEGRKWFLLSHFFKSAGLTFYSTRHRDLYQVRWSDDSNLWHQWRWRCQSPKRRGTSGEEI